MTTHRSCNSSPTIGACDTSRTERPGPGTCRTHSTSPVCLRRRQDHLMLYTSVAGPYWARSSLARATELSAAGRWCPAIESEGATAADRRHNRFKVQKVEL